MQIKFIVCKYSLVVITICVIATCSNAKYTTSLWRDNYRDQNVTNKFGHERATKQYNKALNDYNPNLNITELIKRNGYPIQQHTVTTIDDYHLTMFRIPRNGPTVFLMHGLECNSYHWLMTGKDQGLGYLLADAGYDVWLGNARGTLHSRSHARLSPDDKEFWDFCWDDIGRYDLPAMIDYILKLTNQKQLQYIGHSQGTTTFFVMCSEKPEYNNKISIMISLAASAWQKHAKSPLVQVFGSITPFLSLITRVIGYTSSKKLLPKVTTRAFRTEESAVTLLICTTLLFLLTGFDYAQINSTYLARFFVNFPEGSSIKQYLHYGQSIFSGKFRRYDYGPIENMIKYGSIEPPDYPVEKITARIVFFHSDNDWFSQIADVKTLMNKLSNYDFYRIPLRTFNHMDYLLANDVKTLVNDKVIMYLG